MYNKNKLKTSMKTTVLYFFILWMCNTGVITSEDCTKLSTCSCDCDGKTLDLTALADKTGPKYKDYQSQDGYKYSYNPCVPFTETEPTAFEDHCHSVAACQVIESGGSFQFYDTGTQDSVKFFTTIGTEVMLDTDDTVVVAQYEAEGGGRKTEVVLHCIEGETKFDAYGELPYPTPTYRFILSSPHCCFEGGGMSAGTILIIIACVLFVAYVIVGVMYNAVRNKAGGSGLFTHVLIISACPGLVKDGFFCVISRGKRTSYEAPK